MNHGAGLGVHRRTGLEVDVKDCICVAVVDAVSAAMERATVRWGCAGRLVLLQLLLLWLVLRRRLVMLLLLLWVTLRRLIRHVDVMMAVWRVVLGCLSLYPGD